MLSIVCDCEGLLEQPHGGPVVHCTRCRKEYPFKELKTILMLLKKASYVPSSAQQSAPNEHEQRAAINKAAIKLCRLKLRVAEEETPQPVQPAPRPAVYRRPVYTTAAAYNTTTATTGFPGGFVNVHIRINVVG